MSGQNLVMKVGLFGFLVEAGGAMLMFGLVPGIPCIGPFQ